MSPENGVNDDIALQIQDSGKERAPQRRQSKRMAMRFSSFPVQDSIHL